MKLFEYRVLFIPTGSKKEITPKVLASGETFAKSQKEVELECAMMIPTTYKSKLDQIVIATRTF